MGTTIVMWFAAIELETSKATSGILRTRQTLRLPSVLARPVGIPERLGRLYGLCLGARCTERVGVAADRRLHRLTCTRAISSACERSRGKAKSGTVSRPSPVHLVRTIKAG